MAKNPQIKIKKPAFAGSFEWSQLLDFMAEREGFEPSIRYNRILDFESSAFDHSATFPASVDFMAPKCHKA
jgi:hypothetical protein